MNTNRDVLSGSDLEMPSGFEVESATFHPPVTVSTGMPVTTSERSGMRGKLDDLKSRGLSTLHDMQHTLGDRTSVLKQNLGERTALMKQTMSDRTSVLKSNLQRSVTSAKSSVRSTADRSMMNMRASMQNSPGKWAGIAAGSGFALGMLGRFIHWRNKHQHHYAPQLVIIESSC